MKSPARPSRRPTCDGMTTPKALLTRKLAGYLAGAAGTAATLAAPQAEAAVTAVTFAFGPVFNATDDVGGYGTYFAVNNVPGDYLGYLQGWATADFLQLGGFTTTPYAGLVYHNKSFDSNFGLPVFFATGTVVGTGLNLGAGGGLGYAVFQDLPSGGPTDFTADQLNKNIAFQTSNGNWGWANVSWDEALKSLTINEAWVESTALAPITINAAPAHAPEPSRALLALAGLCGVALRRRRKQAV
jgi:MYXO-CTERM domain-containing protein